MRPAIRLALPALALAAACAAPASLEELGAACRSERDPARRLDLVRRIIGTGDERAIPVLIDCLEAARLQAKEPDRVYGAAAVEPNETAPPEFWGLHVITGRDFDLDARKWRAWYEACRGRLAWDGAARRFIER